MFNTKYNKSKYNKSKTIRDEREKNIHVRSQRAHEGKETDDSFGRIALPNPDIMVYEDNNDYKDYKDVHFERTFPIDESQELMTHIANIKHLIETQYTFRGTPFYDIYVETGKLYKHYFKYFLDTSVLNTKKYRDERVRILTILTGVLYPYYLRKEREATSATQEEFIMCILYYYFSIAHHSKESPDGINDVYGLIKNNVPFAKKRHRDVYYITSVIETRLTRVVLFLLTLEPELSDILMPTRGGKPKTRKNNQQKRRRTSKRNKRI